MTSDWSDLTAEEVQGLIDAVKRNGRCGEAIRLAHWAAVCEGPNWQPFEETTNPAGFAAFNEARDRQLEHMARSAEVASEAYEELFGGGAR